MKQIGNIPLSSLICFSSFAFSNLQRGQSIINKPYMSSAEGQKGATCITIQRCSVEIQKSTIAIDIVQW